MKYYWCHDCNEVTFITDVNTTVCPKCHSEEDGELIDRADVNESVRVGRMFRADVDEGRDD